MGRPHGWLGLQRSHRQPRGRGQEVNEPPHDLEADHQALSQKYDTTAGKRPASIRVPAFDESVAGIIGFWHGALRGFTPSPGLPDREISRQRTRRQVLTDTRSDVRCSRRDPLGCRLQGGWLRQLMGFVIHAGALQDTAQGRSRRFQLHVVISLQAEASALRPWRSRADHQSLRARQMTTLFSQSTRTPASPTRRSSLTAHASPPRCRTISSRASCSPAKHSASCRRSLS